MMRATLSVVSLAMMLGVGATAIAQRAAKTSTLTETFEAANVAASRGDYARAASGYTALIDAGVRDADVFFNLATSFAQARDYGRAILNYERALLVRPGDDEAEDNLRKAEQALEEARAEREGEATIQRSDSIGDAVYGMLTEDALAYALLFANLVFFACLIEAWIRRRRSLRVALVGTGAALLLLFSALGLGVKAGMLREGPRAVALADRVVLREGPDPQAQARGLARSGDRGQVLDSDRDFVKLRVISGAEGWALAADVGLIDLDERLH